MLRDIPVTEMGMEEDEVVFERAQTLVNETREEVSGMNKKIT